MSLKAVDSAALAEGWKAFLAAPAQCLAPSRLSEVLGEVAEADTRAALARHPRFQPRLVEAVIRRHGLTPPEALPVPEAPDVALFQLAPEAGDELVRCCGMICHAATLASEIRAARVIALKARFGEVPFMVAVGHRELACAAPLTSDDDEALEDAVQRDGVACVAAWLAQLPAELAAWLRLGLVAEVGLAEAEIPPRIRDHGVAIVRGAAAAMVEAQEASTT